MKKVQSYVPCEFCGKHLSVDSAPPHRAYERGEIHIAGGSTVLLPDAAVARRHIDGVVDGHAVDIDGHYCDLSCLVGHIRAILGKDAPRVLPCR